MGKKTIIIGVVILLLIAVSAFIFFKQKEKKEKNKNWVPDYTDNLPAGKSTLISSTTFRRVSGYVYKKWNNAWYGQPDVAIPADDQWVSVKDTPNAGGKSMEDWLNKQFPNG